MGDELDWRRIHCEGYGMIQVLATQGEIDEIYSLNTMNCHHEVRELRDYQTSNGGWQRKEQCTRCGKSASQSFKRDPDVQVPLWDETIYEEWEAEVRDRRRYLEGVLISRTAEIESEGYASYEEYLKTESWRHRRDATLLRDNGLCQACLVEQATEVHHLSYDRIFSEPIFDLVSVCQKCHEKIHHRKIISKAAARAKGRTP